MTSLTAWTDMMDQFLNELICTFPEENAMKKYKTAYELVKKSNPRKCIESFMSSTAQYQEQIMSKDESLLTNENIKNGLLKDLNIKTHWNDDLSANTKDAIWQYLQTLHILGTTITMIPQEALSMIETVATDCAANMQNGGQFNPSALSGLFSSLGNMMGASGNGGLLEKN
jgi:hypothetical protein